jgi:hypothetical protein
MPINDLALLRQITGRIQQHFAAIPTGSFAPPTKRELAKIPHPEWIPEQIKAFWDFFNGYRFAWTTTPAQQEQYKDREHRRLRNATGRIDLQRLQDIYSSWEGVVYFKDQPLENERLRDFKVIDMFADEAGVGIYHDERRDPELYLCGFSEYDPEPLGVDFEGYLQLLTLSLGNQNAPYMLRELNEYFTRQPALAFITPQNPSAQYFVYEMTALVPDFSQEAFVALYDQVRLRR